MQTSSGRRSTDDRGTAVRTFLIADGVGQVWVYPATGSQWEQAACAVAGRNLTKAEWTQYVPDRPHQKTWADQP